MEHYSFLRGVVRGIVAVLLVIGGTSAGRAQYITDALRLGQFGSVGARALGMGGAYTGVASDYSAIFWNPAGLAQLTHGEFFTGLSILSNGDNGTLSSSDLSGNTTLLGNATSYTNNATTLNALGIVYPIPVRRGSLVLAFGFNRGDNFTAGTSFTGFNPNSSIIETFVPASGTNLPSDLATNAPWYWQLGLIDSLNGKYREIFPFTGPGLRQRGTVTESGGLNNWSGAIAGEVSKNLYLGVTLTLVSGSYTFTNDYRENAAQGAYAFPYDLQELRVKQNVQDDITGFNAKFGLMYTVPDHFRLGIGIRTPTSFNVKEDFTEDVSTQFYTADANGYSFFGPIRTQDGSNTYDVHTPWVLSGGASVILQQLVLSGDIEYTDWTQLEFANANSDLLALNSDIKTVLRSTVNLRGGAEYEFLPVGLRLRAGFMYNPSPYQNDPSSFAQKYFTVGAGILLSGSAMLDLAYAHGWWKTNSSNYQSVSSRYSSDVQEDITTNTFLATLVFRF